MEAYRLLAEALAADGINCHFQTRGQLVVSSQVGPTWPNRGNSFWVAHVHGQWFLFTWVPVAYAVTASVDIAALCRKCMNYGTSAMYEVPPHLVAEYSLRELSEPEAEAVYAGMEQLPEPESD